MAAEPAETIVILCSGQSNARMTQAYSYTPATNVDVSNYIALTLTESTVELHVEPLEDNLISWGPVYCERVRSCTP